MRVALDTNILVYAEGIGDAQRHAGATGLIARLPVDAVVLPVPALGELYRVLTRKAGWERDRARAALMNWTDSFAIGDSSWEAFQSALEISVDHQLSIWDSLVLAVGAANKCRLVLSEDLQHGFSWGGVTVVNPFAVPMHPVLAALLSP